MLLNKESQRHHVLRRPKEEIKKTYWNLLWPKYCSSIMLLICGWSPVCHTSVRLTPCNKTENRRDKVQYSEHVAELLFTGGTWHEFANSFLGRWLCRKTSSIPFSSLFNPALRTLMISAVKTKCTHLLLWPYPTGDPWRPMLARGSLRELDFGGSRCLVRRKLNNFKVHMVKRCKTYFNTFFTLSLSLPVGAPPLYVCLRQCERVKVCVILQCISILLHLCSQKVSCWNKEYQESGGLWWHFGARRRKNKQAAKGWIEMLLWVWIE